MDLGFTPPRFIPSEWRRWVTHPPDTIPVRVELGWLSMKEITARAVHDRTAPARPRCYPWPLLSPQRAGGACRRSDAFGCATTSPAVTHRHPASPTGTKTSALTSAVGDKGRRDGGCTGTGTAAGTSGMGSGREAAPGGVPLPAADVPWGGWIKPPARGIK